MRPLCFLRETLSNALAGFTTHIEYETRLPSEQGRILFDKDGNASLNLANPEVQAELRGHIEALGRIQSLELQEVNILKTTLHVEAPSFDPNVKRWKFRVLDGTALVDISETDIAADTLKRGGAFVGDAYRVLLQITEKQGKKGPLINYKALEVLDYIPGSRQSDLLNDTP